MEQKALIEKLHSEASKTQKKFSLTRHMYIAKFTQGTTPHEVFATESGVVVYKFLGGPGGQKPCAMIFIGKQNKPVTNAYFYSEESRESHIQKIIQSVEYNKKKTAERRQERKAPHSLEVGKILVSSWGYDQTNIDFYEVTKLIGSTMVEIRRLHERLVSVEGTYQYVEPIPGQYVETGWRAETMRKRVCPRTNSVSLNSFASAYPWKGKPECETHPLFGR